MLLILIIYDKMTTIFIKQEIRSGFLDLEILRNGCSF
jgi:hypothetical protein